MSESQIDIDNRIAEAFKDSCDFEREQREKDPIKLRRVRKFYKAFHKAASSVLTKEQFREVMDFIDWELLEE